MENARIKNNMLELSPNQIPEDLKKFFRPKRKYGAWTERNEIIWHKPSCIPSTVYDRFNIDFEKIFFFTKNKRYYFEQQYEPLKSKVDILARRMAGNKNRERLKITCRDYFCLKNRTKEQAIESLKKGRIKRCVWSITCKYLKENHLAPYPIDLMEAPVKAGCPVGGIVLDPFMGSGTSALLATQLNRKFIGIEKNKEYIEIANKRIEKVNPNLPQLS